ncbi:Required for respiratory growth protein 9, mitochondrial [Hypsizygus marmoreus]|uniref:Required for respiratory growth protein 9, mitochondrial n=1 Tax=Hypsizygus marmoreus TaxID=39966 RepID=A0A369KDB6_HYPMA|nr:Required for respiratory growth protein 9, mitochondrial [Hypsizygus marmoreus]
MSFWFRNVSLLNCHRATLARFYSVDIAPESRHKWSLSGLPRPKSLFDDDTPVDLTEDNEIVNGARPNTPSPHLRRPPDKPTPSEFKTHREAIRKNFPEGWAPPRKLSREAMEGVRQMHRFDPEKFSTPVLAEKFKVSPEAVRRILKSKWEPPREKRLKIAEREREERAAYFKLNRERERIEARRVAESARAGDTRDRLTFE